jgi:type III restriction enzyme
MVAQFLKDISSDPQFDPDKAFLWFSFSEESYVQSKKKLFDYYGGANELNLLDLNDLSRGKLEKNNVFFINWQKIKASTKEGRVLRTPTEYTYGDNGIFDEFIKRTREDGRELDCTLETGHKRLGGFGTDGYFDTKKGWCHESETEVQCGAEAAGFRADVIRDEQSGSTLSPV